MSNMIDTDEKPIEITPFITVRGVSWYEDVIIKGLYDEDLSKEYIGNLKVMKEVIEKA